jgi:hypothetical protein
MAVAGAFTQAKTSTINFLVIPQKIAKVNSLRSSGKTIMAIASASVSSMCSLLHRFLGGLQTSIT